MAPLTPQQTAEALAVSAQTLRRWSAQFAEFLSADATPGRGRRRLYTIADLGLLRRAGALLRAHSVDETIALLRVTPDQASTQALEALTLPDLVAEAAALREVVKKLAGEIGELKQAQADQAADLANMRAEIARALERQHAQRKALEAELTDMRAQLADLQARRSWWQRLRGR